MSGLFAGLMLRQHGFAVDIYERVESELSGRGAGIVAQPDRIADSSGLGISSANLGVEVEARKILDAAGTDLRARISADADGLGAALPHPARCISAGALSSRQGTEER